MDKIKNIFLSCSDAVRGYFLKQVVCGTFLLFIGIGAGVTTKSLSIFGIFIAAAAYFIGVGCYRLYQCFSGSVVGIQGTCVNMMQKNGRLVMTLQTTGENGEIVFLLVNIPRKSKYQQGNKLCIYTPSSEIMQENQDTYHLASYYFMEIEKTYADGFNPQTVAASFEPEKKKRGLFLKK